jgi:hypothetical protein
MLDGVASPSKNDLMLFIGFATCFLLPAIAIFDMHEFGDIHNTCALLFFGTASIESLMYTYEIRKHKDMFPLDTHDMIDRTAYWSWALFGCEALMGVALGLWGTGYFLGPWLEWASTFLLLNYYLIINFKNPYFSSITVPGKIVTPEQYVR